MLIDPAQDFCFVSLRPVFGARHHGVTAPTQKVNFFLYAQLGGDAILKQTNKK